MDQLCPQLKDCERCPILIISYKAKRKPQERFFENGYELIL